MSNGLILKTVLKEVETEVIEKKSRFIANLYPITSKKEAEEKITNIKKKYRDARHHCFAFSVYEENQKYTKCSDDGEPSGTAGVPILNVIEKNELTNILIVVTRYFGGILLGTGGLTRAYSKSATDVIQETEIIEIQEGMQVKLLLNYQESEDFKLYCKKNHISITKTDFSDKVVFYLELSQDQYESLVKQQNENQGGFHFDLENCVVICRKYVKNGK